MVSGPEEVTEKKNIIYIQPLYELESEFKEEILKHLKAFYYPMSIKVKSKVEMPEVETWEIAGMW